MKTKGAIKIFLDIFMTIIFLLLMKVSITGILISRYVLTSISVNNTSYVYLIHKISAYITLILIGLHILIHDKYLIYGIKNIFNNIKTQSVKRAIYLTFAVLFICAVAYTPVSSILSNNNTNSKGNNSGLEDGIYGAS